MCCICNAVNCIRKKLFCCGNSRGDYYRYNSSRYCEPRTNVVCANQCGRCFEPCCDNEDTRCNKNHHHDCFCED